MAGMGIRKGGSFMALKPKQKLLAELMVAKPELTNEQYAEEIGIDPKTLYNWKKNSEFQEYINELCKNKFADLQTLAIAKLRENVEAKNQKAIEYALDYLGYKATTKVEADISSDITINVGED